jgi:hypothetical protein
MMRRPTTQLSIALLAGALLLACGETDEEALPGATSQELPVGHVPISESGAPASQAATPVTVLETMDAGGYTYARVEVEGEEAWLAGPQTAISVGDELTISDALPMEDFTSSTLNRTFDLVYFVRAYRKPGEVPAGPSQSTPSGAIGGAQGTVSEVLVGGGYSYVNVEIEGESLWLAGPMAVVSEGQTVSWQGGSRMDGFTSSTLNRSFEKILFVEGISVIP